MTDAGLFTCLNCGAPNRPSARKCEFCRAPIATVRCGLCFEMSPLGARHCAACGSELDVTPGAPALDRLSANYQRTAPACPECQSTLEPLYAETGTLFDCPECGGHFIEHSRLRALLEPAARLGHALPQRLHRFNPLADRVRYRPCPVCKELMQRKNFGGQSGVIIDCCAKHGTWFDREELPRVLAFASAGGLEHARQEERAQARDAHVQFRSIELEQQELEPLLELARAGKALLTWLERLFEPR